MAILKHRAIHVSPRAHLKYILNPGKNEDMKYCSFICCSDNYESVCEDFKELYETFADNKFDNYSKRKNESIRIHSYIQSFDESVSAEEAHRIGVEWAKAMFGEDRPVVISTHTNTGHCHNHIAVCAYDVRGNRWFANKMTYQMGRDISDRICLEHGLSIIEKSKNKGLCYAEWNARKTRTSWKIKMADTIDRLILENDVTDIVSLIAKMREHGYVFTNENRLIAKPQNVKYGCSLSKLGYGYTYEMLSKRIANKQWEYAGVKISGYLNVQVDYAVTIREKQIELYRSQDTIYDITYFQVRRQFELLNFIHENHIHSVDDMKALVDKERRNVERLGDIYAKKSRDKKLLEMLKENGDEYARLLSTENRTKEQQKRLEYLYGKFISVGLCGRDTHSDGWLEKLKNQLKSNISDMVSLEWDIKKANENYYRRSCDLSMLENILETDYDRIKKRMEIEKQIEMYHRGYELQEDGTYIREPEPTAMRDAELLYLAEREEEERQHRLEAERRDAERIAAEKERQRMEQEARERERRRRNNFYAR